MVISLSLTGAALSFNTNAAPENVPLVIQSQGSFAVGGTVITEPGTFNPYKPMDSAGQTFHGDNAYVFYQIT